MDDGWMDWWMGGWMDWWLDELNGTPTTYQIESKLLPLSWL